MVAREQQKAVRLAAISCSPPSHPSLPAGCAAVPPPRLATGEPLPEPLQMAAIMLAVREELDLRMLCFYL